MTALDDTTLVPKAIPRPVVIGRNVYYPVLS